MRVRYEFSSKKTRKSRKPSNTNKHNVAFPAQVLKVIDTSEIILEVLDARFIDKTRNLEIEKEILRQGKKLILILNKIDLVDLKEFKQNTELASLKPYVMFSSKSKIGKKRLKDVLKIEVKKLKMTRKARIGIIGYPNTGKSSLINALVGSKVSGTSKESGFTTSVNKIRLNKDVFILDTPGVIPEKEIYETRRGDFKKHVQMGVRTYDKIKDPDFIVADIMKENPGQLEEHYKIDANGDSEVLLEGLALRYNFKKKGGIPDLERAARLIVMDFQKGEIKAK